VCLREAVPGKLAISRLHAIQCSDGDHRGARSRAQTAAKCRAMPMA
jgi:hypothetical protein